ncbi:MAG: hypothetical protein ACRD0D_01845, partial [Acidimicrobiales bacterium]
MRNPSGGPAGPAEAPHSAHLRCGRPGKVPGCQPAEGLRMTQQEYAHQPVMTEEVVAAFAPARAAPGIIVDAT